MLNLLLLISLVLSPFSFTDNATYDYQVIASSNVGVLSPIVYNETLYWGEDYSPYNSSKLMSLDLNNDEITVVYESSYIDATIDDISINDSWLIWTDNSFNGLSTKIISMDLSNGVVKPIVEISDEALILVSPVLVENYVVWIDPLPSKPQLVEMDLTTSEISVVYEFNEFSFYNTFIDEDSNRILLTDSTDEGGLYLIYDCDTKEVVKYEAPFKFPGYAKLQGTKIYSINFDDYRYWTAQKFGYYDLKNEVYTDLSTTFDSYINSFDLIDNCLVAIDGNGMVYTLNDQDERVIVKKIPDLKLSFVNGYSESMLGVIENQSDIEIIRLSNLN